MKQAETLYRIGNMIKCQIIDLNYQIDLKLCGKPFKFSLCEGNFKVLVEINEFSIKFKIKFNLFLFLLIIVKKGIITLCQLFVCPYEHLVIGYIHIQTHSTAAFLPVHV